MWKSILQASVLTLALALPGLADESKDQAKAAKTYTLGCSIIRKFWATGSGNKHALHEDKLKIPNITTLEGALAEYHSGGKVGQVPYGFRLHAEVKRAAEAKIRLEVFVEDSSADGGWNATIRAKSQRVVRQIPLGKTIKLAVEELGDGAGVWVELTVKETREE